MFGAIWRLIKDCYLEFSECLGNAIDERDIRYIVLYSLLGIVSVVACCGLIAFLTYLFLINLEFLFAWIGLPILSIWGISYWIKSSNKNDTSGDEEIIDPVDEELARQRAIEKQDDMLALTYSGVESTSRITPLLRPYDMSDIKISSPKGYTFYMKDREPVYQYECDLETAIDKAMEDTIQRELQRYINKNVSRYPFLISSESQGRAPVEVLDVKNLGGRVLIEICQCTSASLPMIEARRRARIERQQRQQTFIDQDYPE